MKMTTLISALALSFTLAPLSYGASHSTPCDCKHHMSGKLAKELSLSTEQESKIHAIKEKFKQTVKPLHEKAKMLQTEIQHLSHTDTIDKHKLDSLITQKKETLGEIMKEKSMMKNEVYNVLTAEQKVKFNAMIDKKEAGMHHQHPVQPTTQR